VVRAPRGSTWRRALRGLGLSLVLISGLAAFASRAEAQGVEGTVQLEPVLTVVPWRAGSFEVNVRTDNLVHHGSIGYDDDDDDIVDRRVPSEGLGAFELRLAFDGGVLAVEEAEPGRELTGSRRSFQCLERSDGPGSFAVGCVSSGANIAGPQGDLTLATLTFRLVGGGATWILLESELAGPLGDDIPVRSLGGAARVTGAPKATATGGPGEPTAGPRTPRPPGATEPGDARREAGRASAARRTATAAANATATRQEEATATARARLEGATPNPSAQNQARVAGDSAGDGPGVSRAEPAATGGSGGPSSAQVVLWSLGAAVGLGLGSAGALLLAGRLGKPRGGPPGPWG